MLRKEINQSKFYIAQHTTHPDLGIHLEAVRLILILLNFASDFRHFPSLAEVYQLSVAQKVWIALLDMQDVGEIHAEERHARRINRAQLLLILPVMILVELAAFAQHQLVTLLQRLVGELESMDGR